MLHDWFQQLAVWYEGALATGGYPLVALLMAIESSIVPLPSEIVIPPAAHFAKTNGGMSLPGIVIAGALGSWVGATAMYWAARLAGRPLVLRYGKYVLIPQQKVFGAERWAARFGGVGIFLSRLLPVVRHLIGIPAGIVKLDYRVFSAFTLIGSAVWCGVLCWLGVTMGKDPEILHGDARKWGIWIAGIVGALGFMYYVLVHRFMKGAETAPATAAAGQTPVAPPKTSRPRSPRQGRKKSR